MLYNSFMSVYLGLLIGIIVGFIGGFVATGLLMTNLSKRQLGGEIFDFKEELEKKLNIKSENNKIKVFSKKEAQSLEKDVLDELDDKTKLSAN